MKSEEITDTDEDLEALLEVITKEAFWEQLEQEQQACDETAQGIQWPTAV